ncbi:hypothetical protein MMC30_000830 [Trapelia coarctata]|nr:hypothetical protein [Trapelia coarctata]
MRRIYSQASHVFISLGLDYDNTEQAVDFATEYYHYHPQASPVPVRIEHSEEVEEALIGITDLVAREWFFRKWIIQEVAVCPKRIMMFGGLVFNWKVLSTIIAALDPPAILLPKPVKMNAGRVRRRNRVAHHSFDLLRGAIERVAKRNPLPLKDLLDASDQFDSTDPRDKIYALLGIAADAESFLDVDYSKPVGDVYSEFTRALIAQGHLDYVLGRSGRCSPSEDLPSWIPDWRWPTYYMVHMYLPSVAAGIPAEISYEYGPEAHPLILKRSFVCIIAGISAEFDRQHLDATFDSSLRIFER